MAQDLEADFLLFVDFRPVEAGAEFRIEVLPVRLEFQQKRHMVDAGGKEAEFFVRRSGPLRNLPRSVLHAVAEPGDPDGPGAPGERDGVHRHRVHVVQQICAGTLLLHDLENFKEILQRAQSAKNSAGAERVGDDLVDAVFHRDFILEFLVPDRPGAEDRDDVVRAVQRFAEVGRGVRGEADAELCRDEPGDGDRVGQPPGIDIHQRDLVRPQLRVGQDILEKILGEDDAARADQYDFRHESLHELHFCVSMPILYR